MYYILGAVAVLVAIVLVVIIRTIKFSKGEEVEEVVYDSSPINKDEVIEKLQSAIRIKTISNSDYSKTDWNEFDKFHVMLEEKFPLMHEKLEKTVINKYSLIYKWKGKDSSKKPGMIMAHMDVVPVDAGTIEEWDAAPFSGEIKDGFLYGRGTLDIKIHLITSMEACETLLKEGYTPNRDMYFCYGHDEEVGGKEGAANTLEYFKKKNIRFDYILDEGGAVNSGAIASVSKNAAFIGVAEKGYSNIKVSIKGSGGHASTPPKNTSLGLVSQVICDIEKKKMKMHFTSASMNMIKTLALHMNFFNKMVIANLWLFKPLFLKAFGKSGTTGEALLRTTIAPTMATASMAPNVLPQVASFTVNCRILQGDTGTTLVNHIKDICKGYDYKIDVLRLDEPSNVSDCNSDIFKMLSSITAGIYEDVAVVPYLMVAGTDCYKFEGISDQVLRFTPYFITKEDMGRIHNANERISTENIVNCVRFFKTLLKNY